MKSFDLLSYCEIISQVRGHGKLLQRLDHVFPQYGRMITSWLSPISVIEGFALIACQGGRQKLGYHGSMFAIQVGMGITSQYLEISVVGVS